MSLTQKTISPIDGKVVVERPYATPQEALAAVKKGHEAFKKWKNVSLQDRCKYVEKMVDYMVAKKDEIGREIALQMGRPIRYAPNEVNGFAERARYMCKIAVESLATKEVVDADRPGFKRFIKREPLGVVFVIPAWNYPLLTAVNGIVPAILSGIHSYCIVAD